jgi:lactoylglutathione lyase
MFIEDKERAKSFYETTFGVEPVYEDKNTIAFEFENMVVNLLLTSQAHDLIAPAVVAGKEGGARFQLTSGSRMRTPFVKISPGAGSS